jgi:hypothetical protein
MFKGFLGHCTRYLQTGPPAKKTTLFYDKRIDVTTVTNFLVILLITSETDTEINNKESLWMAG